MGGTPETLTKLHTIVGVYSTSIAEKALKDADILYTVTPGEHETFTFSVPDEHRSTAMRVVEKAMQEEVDRLLDQ